MKLFNDLKQLVILGICAGCVAAMPIAASAAQPASNGAQAQQMDKTKGNNDASDVSKDDNPPKPPPKPGPRDGGADD